MRAVNWVYRQMLPVAIVGAIAAVVWVSAPGSAVKPLPEPLQKYLGRSDYPAADEADPRTRSGPSIEQAITRTGGRLGDAIE